MSRNCQQGIVSMHTRQMKWYPLLSIHR